MVKKLLVAAILACSTSSFAAMQEDVYFSPNGGVEAQIVKYIGEAQTSLYIAAYNFTSDAVGDALVAASKRGVKVHAVIDSKAAVQRNNQVCKIVAAGADVLIDHKHPIHHNKYIIVDEKNVETGSFNYSGNAEHKNAENALFLRGDPTLAAKYIQAFGTHYAHSIKPECGSGAVSSGSASDF